MVWYRILFVLAAVPALLLLFFAGQGLLTGFSEADAVWAPTMLAVAAGILFGARALAHRGRPVLACLLLLVLVLPGLPAMAAITWLKIVGFGPHH